MAPVVVSHLARLSLGQDTVTVFRTAQVVRTWRDNTRQNADPFDVVDMWDLLTQQASVAASQQEPSLSMNRTCGTSMVPRISRMVGTFVLYHS